MGLASFSEPVFTYLDVHGLENVPVVVLNGFVDGKHVGIGGIAFHPTGHACVFCLLFSPEARKHPMTLHKAALRVIKLARELGLRHLFATADTDVSVVAEPWLRRLGFVKYETLGNTGYMLNLEEKH